MATNLPSPDDYHVLLFYKYTSLRGPLAAFRDEQERICRSLRLTGRLRVAAEGVNGNLGGSHRDLDEYAARLRANPAGEFADTDFKYGALVPGRPADEQKMTGLIVKITKELVSLGAAASAAHVADGGRHLSPEEFHAMLTSGGNNCSGDGKHVHDGGARATAASDRSDVVLLDTRNVYETRIGLFEAPGVPTVDPDTRQFSDLPLRFQDPTLMSQLKGRKILMYCTGGVRCERASALLKSHGEGFENVFQLRGGIHRYVEQFGASGYFKGRNFVFDERMSTASEGKGDGKEGNVKGTCCACDAPFDDYTYDYRCSACRMRILLCTVCQQKESGVHRVCELCTQRAGDERYKLLGDGDGNVTAALHASCSGQPARAQVAKIAKILCYHDLGGSSQSCKQALRRVSNKLRKQATFHRYAQSKFATAAPTVAAMAAAMAATASAAAASSSASNDSNSNPISTRHFHPRPATHSYTWFPVNATGNASHTLAQTLGNILDAAVEALPCHGVLGIGEGAGAAAFLLALSTSASDDEVLRLLDRCWPLPDKCNVGDGSDGNSRGGGTNTVNIDTSSSDSSNGTSNARYRAIVRTLRERPFNYGIFINGRLPKKEAVPEGFSLDFFGLSAAQSHNSSTHDNARVVIAPSLHIDFRTRQHLAVFGQRFPLTAQMQKDGVQHLYEVFKAASAPALLCCPEPEAPEKMQKRLKKRERKRRKLMNQKMGAMFEVQPPTSIRSFAVIEALRSFCVVGSL